MVLMYNDVFSIGMAQSISYLLQILQIVMLNFQSLQVGSRRLVCAQRLRIPNCDLRLKKEHHFILKISVMLRFPMTAESY